MEIATELERALMAEGFTKFYPSAAGFNTYATILEAHFRKQFPGLAAITRLYVNKNELNTELRVIINGEVQSLMIANSDQARLFIEARMEGEGYEEVQSSDTLHSIAEQCMPDDLKVNYDASASRIFVKKVGGLLQFRLFSKGTVNAFQCPEPKDQ